MSTHLLDEEKYIEDGYIDTTYFGGLLEGQGLFTPYFEEGYIEEGYIDNAGMVFVLSADLTIAITIQEAEANLSSAFAVNADVLLLVLAEASVSSDFASTADVNKITGFASDISSEIAVDITGTKILAGLSSISSVASLASVGARTRDADSAVSAEFTQSALVGAIRQGEVSVTGAFSPTLVATFLRLGDIDMVSALAISVDAERTRDPNATTLANIINLSAQGDKLPGSVITVDIAASLEATLDPLKLAEADVSAIFAAAITGRVVKGFNATLNSIFHQGTQTGDDFTTNVEAIFPLEADLSAATSTSVSGDRFRTTDIDFQSIATQMSVAGFLQSDIANLVSSFAITADVGVIKQGAGGISTSASAEATAGAIRLGAASMSVEAAQSTATDAINGFAADLASEFFIGHTDDLGFNSDVLPSVVKEFDTSLVCESAAEINIVRILGSTSELDTNASASVTATKLVDAVAIIQDAVVFQATITINKLGDIDSSIVSSMSALASRTRTSGSVPTAVSGCVIDPSTVFELQSNFAINATLTAVIGTLNISTDRTYVIPREYRIYAIPTENRGHTITRENRVYILQGAA